MKLYSIYPATASLNSLASWENDKHEVIEIDQFLPESSSHHPQTLLRLAYKNDYLYGIFEVDDCFVRCVHTTFQSETYRDSCVELFLQPNQQGGYFNFEWNCCGTLAVFYITDPTRSQVGFKEYTLLTAEDAANFQSESSLHGVIDPEITKPIKWKLAFTINTAVLRYYTSFPRLLTGQNWRANAYKCADDSSHPHWAAWSPVPERNFHLPHHFGNFQFL